MLVLLTDGVRAVPPGPPPVKDLAGSSVPPVAWTHEFTFDDGLQGWTIDPGSNPTLPARWVNPAWEPNGPVLPDGQPSGSSGLLGNASSGGGGGSLYLPGDNSNSGGTSPESVAERTVLSLIGVNSIESFVLQVDVYVPNLLPLTGFRHSGAYPGNHLESAGFCTINDGNGRSMCLEGAGTSSGSGINGYLRFRDFSGSAGNTWQFPTCCSGKTILDLEGLWQTCNNTTPTDKVNWWNNWVTLYLNYNYSKPGEVYVWAYIPWQHPEPNCEYAANASGWIEISRRAIGAEGIPVQAWTKFQLSGRFSWTQGQWDNVKLSIPVPCNAIPADVDNDADVDMDDFAVFQRCYTGPSPAPGVYKPANCRCFDRYPFGAPDNAIDHEDFNLFTQCATRSGVPASSTNCP